MIENALELNKVVGEHPLAKQTDHIFSLKTRDGKQFSGKLKRIIEGKRLVFEQRNGATVIINDDEIAYAYEIPARRA